MVMGRVRNWCGVEDEGDMKVGMRVWGKRGIVYWDE